MTESSNPICPLSIHTNLVQFSSMEYTRVQSDDLPNDEDPSSRKRTLLVAVQVRPGRTPVHLSCGHHRVNKGDYVVFMTEQGKTIGEVISPPIPVDLPCGHVPPQIEGPVTIEERERHFSNLQWEQEAREVCQRLIQTLGLPMKLIDVETLFDRGKTTFFYVSEGRVDFRELVRELVKALRVRVEMRQVSSRCATKHLGGIGACGLPLCCATFLRSFDPVSIKMAKAQNLSLNPAKISGVCGRLLCCLAYEYANYLHPEPVPEPSLPDALPLQEISPASMAGEDEKEESEMIPSGDDEEPDATDTPQRKRPRRRRRRPRQVQAKGATDASMKNKGAWRGRKGGTVPPSKPPSAS